MITEIESRRPAEGVQYDEKTTGRQREARVQKKGGYVKRHGQAVIFTPVKKASE
jgi:hypothetical protein